MFIMWIYVLLSIKSKQSAFRIFFYIYLLKLKAMATKKTTTKKSASEKTGFYSIGAKIGKLASGIIAGKDGVIETVKSTIQNITTSKKYTPKKTVKITTKKVASKQLNPVTKKSAKPTIVKKPSLSKKVIKKATKKVATKK